MHSPVARFQDVTLGFNDGLFIDIRVQPSTHIRLCKPYATWFPNLHSVRFTLNFEAPAYSFGGCRSSCRTRIAGLVWYESAERTCQDAGFSSICTLRDRWHHPLLRLLQLVDMTLSIYLNTTYSCILNFVSHVRIYASEYLMRPPPAN